ncbi:NrdJb [Reinekea marina]|uniref:ribonucleoside-diphosphate reductase n=1 Tax=Reinekea marina TaxID=1310421 RepID=A0ABV7WUJ2_9GAMM|nr:NrdJb [Reinekea marina]MBU2863102.1 NrdJb [Reinekea forsetii]MDN3650199.1 NrdJb [Reinekea marina]
MKKINQKIVGFDVVTPEKKAAQLANDAAQAEKNAQAQIEQMHESVERAEMLIGSTYKIKTPMSEHAMYVTINDMVLNEGTEHEVRRPFEIFINSKNMEHYQWVVALTLLISAVFRKGGDITFIVDELSAVFDPQGGYFKRGGKFMPSLVAEIGDVVEKHLKMIGMIKEEGLDEHQQKLIEEKRKQYEAATAAPKSGDAADSGDFPADAHVCKKCNTKAAIIMDGCLTCLNCGDSKCQ